MKVRASFVKLANGSIETKLNIVDPGLYPSALLFDNDYDYPTEQGFELKEGTWGHVKKVLDYAYDAKCWAAVQIKALGGYYEHWCRIETPENYTVDLAECE